jgi:ribonuclease BN (tRNA processing enzyme)
MIGRTDDLLLVTPRSCSEVEIVAKGFAGVYGNTVPFQLIIRELSSKEKMAIERMKIQAFSVVHKGSTKAHGVGKRIPAFGYSISYNDQRVAISGDTGMCQSLKELVKNADLAILEASAKEKTTEISEVHLSIEEAREIGKTAKKFILIHQWP